MRYTSIALVLILLQIGSAQSKTAIFDAIRNSDMNSISGLFDKRIEYCFNDQIEFLDKTTALKAVKAFLDRNVPKSVTPIHQGSSKSDDSDFAIAIMDTMNGRKYRIYVYEENTGGKLLVQELRIDVQK